MIIQATRKKFRIFDLIVKRSSPCMVDSFYLKPTNSPSLTLPLGREF
jgi:hypothetical protein